MLVPRDAGRLMASWPDARPFPPLLLFLLLLLRLLLLRLLLLLLLPRGLLSGEEPSGPLLPRPSVRLAHCLQRADSAELLHSECRLLRNSISGVRATRRQSLQFLDF